MEEVRLDNELINKSMGDDTVVIGAGLDHDLNEISEFEIVDE